MQFRTAFTFACRIVMVLHPELSAAVSYAEHVLNTWKTVSSVEIHDRRRNGHTPILDVTR